MCLCVCVLVGFWAKPPEMTPTNPFFSAPPWTNLLLCVQLSACKHLCAFGYRLFPYLIIIFFSLKLKSSAGMHDKFLKNCTKVVYLLSFTVCLYLLPIALDCSLWLEFFFISWWMFAGCCFRCFYSSKNQSEHEPVY